MALETETKFFDEHRDGWIRDGHEDEWAVVSGSTLFGFFHTIEDGYAAGVEEYGSGNFLLKKVEPHDRVETIQRVYWGTNVQAAG